MSTPQEPLADEMDDYWASEPIENEAVTEWWAQQPEAADRPGRGKRQR